MSRFPYTGRFLSQSFVRRSPIRHGIRKLPKSNKFQGARFWE